MAKSKKAQGEPKKKTQAKSKAKPKVAETPKTDDATETTTPPLSLNASRGFVSILEQQQVSFLFSTYQSAKLFLVGTKPEGGLSIFERTFDRCMGVAASEQTIYMSTIYQIWRMENALGLNQQHQGYDRLYVPQQSYVTGDCDIHDMAVDAGGKLVFINTLFNCIGTTSETHSFQPIWKPPFITELVAEDRCHLNGLAMKDGKPKYVSIVGQTNVLDGWREHRVNGGIIMDIETNEVVCEGLSMPHSPRWYNDKLYVLNSGTGEFGYVNFETKQFEAITFCPGYLRGMSFAGNYAFVGLSSPRERQGQGKERAFSGLPLDERLAQEGVSQRCGIMTINLDTGEKTQLEIEGVVSELYDVVVLPGVKRPMMLGFKTDEIKRTITIAEPEVSFAEPEKLATS